MKTLVSILFLAGVAACGLQVPSQKPAESDKTAAVTALALGEADSGKTIPVQEGQKVTLKLLGTPTAGYVWAVKQSPKFLRLDRESSTPSNPEGRKQGMVGGTDWANFDFSIQALAAGEPKSGELVLIYGRPWEMDNGAPPERTFTLTLAIGAK